MIVLDTESHLIGPGLLVPPTVSASWHDGQSDFDRIRDALPRIERWLDGDEILVGTFIAYDMAAIANLSEPLRSKVFTKYRRGQVDDVSLRQKTIDIAALGDTRQGDPSPYSLLGLAGLYGLPRPDKDASWRLEFAALESVPKEYWPSGAVDYVLGDADLPARVYARQAEYAARWEISAGAPLLHLTPQEAFKEFCLYLISAWGLRTSRERCAALAARLEAFYVMATPRLRRARLVRKDGTRDTKLAKGYMERTCAARGLPVPLTDKGGVCLDKDACKESRSLLLQLYSDYSQITTLRSRVEDLAKGADLPLQTSFNSMLNTSRTSTRKPREGTGVVGMQAQNFPRKLTDATSPATRAYKRALRRLEEAPEDLRDGLRKHANEVYKLEMKKPGAWTPGPRECLEPRPGHLFVVCDLPAAELRSVSQICIELFGFSRLAETLNAGRDPHLWFGGQVLGIDYAEAVLRAAEAVVKEARQQAKPCNFGFWGGMGVDSFIAFAYSNYNIVFTQAQAMRLKALWLEAVPESRPYFQLASDALSGKDRTALKHPRSGFWRGRVGYCQINNSKFQERTARAAADWLCDTQELCYTNRRAALWNSRVVMYTHDEIVTETPIDRCEAVAYELSAVGAEAFNLWHPDVPALAMTGKAKNPRVITGAIGRIYSKDLESKWDGDRLVPWAPEGFIS